MNNVTCKQIHEFDQYLFACEKTSATREKYLRDVTKFLEFIQEMTISYELYDATQYIREETSAGNLYNIEETHQIYESITKEMVLAYKDKLSQNYKLTSANSMIAAINSYFEFIGRHDLKVKAFKFQKQIYRPESKQLTKAEYRRLLLEAKKRDQYWLYYTMLTLGATGMRVSELQFVNVESLKRGSVTVNLKGKSREVILPNALVDELEKFVKLQNKNNGPIFITKSGNPIDRCNIYHAMKDLCEKAQVEPSKVYPHNLRHMFATIYYENEHDIAHLADILGHSNINTTRIYTMIPASEQIRRIDNMGLVF